MKDTIGLFKPLLSYNIKDEKKYFLSYAQYSMGGMGMGPLAAWWMDEWYDHYAKRAITDNRGSFNTNFPDVANESIKDINTTMDNLIDKYTNEAIAKNTPIKYTKTITPLKFIHDGKEYDFTQYNLEITVQKYS